LAERLKPPIYQIPLSFTKIIWASGVHAFETGRPFIYNAITKSPPMVVAMYHFVIQVVFGYFGLWKCVAMPIALFFTAIADLPVLSLQTRDDQIVLFPRKHNVHALGFGGCHKDSDFISSL
jgi:hypothetical protein